MTGRAKRLSQEELAAAVFAAVDIEKGRIRQIEGDVLDRISGGIAGSSTIPPVLTPPVGDPGTTIGMYPTEPTTSVPN